MKTVSHHKQEAHCRIPCLHLTSLSLSRRCFQWSWGQAIHWSTLRFWSLGISSNTDDQLRTADFLRRWSRSHHKWVFHSYWKLENWSLCWGMPGRSQEYRYRTLQQHRTTVWQCCSSKRIRRAKEPSVNTNESGIKANKTKLRMWNNSLQFLGRLKNRNCRFCLEFSRSFL